MEAFVRKAEDVIKDLEKVPGLVETYEKQADLARSWQSREIARGEGSGRRIPAGPGGRNRQYETYVDADGERRREVALLTEERRNNVDTVRGIIREAEAVMEYIDSWKRRMMRMSWTKRHCGLRCGAGEPIPFWD